VTNSRNGPPEKERPSATPGARPAQQLADTTPAVGNRTARWRRCSSATPLGRRRYAAARSVPLADGHRDPWRPWRPERLSDKQVQAAVDAALHLLAADLPPLFDRVTLEAMWRAGYRDLAEQLHARGQAA
jgi:hypothetical protein